MAKSSPVNYPPGPSSRLPLNLFFNFLRDPLTVLHSLSKEYGDISHFKFGGQHIYLIDHPDYIKDVLVTYNNNFIKSRGLQLAKRILGEGLLTSEGELHHSQRQLIQPVFQPDEIPNYANIMTDYALDISNRWNDDDHGKVDIHREFMHLTLAIVSKAFFNISIEESEIKEIDQYVTTLIEYFNRARIPFTGIIEKLPLPNNIHFRHAKKQLDTIIYRIIDSHRNSSSNSNHHHNNKQDGSYPHKDLISLLLQDQTDSYISANENNNKSANKRNKKIHNITINTDKQQLRDNVTTIFLAGHETVANALTWTFYLLSHNPEEEKMLHEEVDSVLDNYDHAVPTVKDIPKLEYTERVFAAFVIIEYNKDRNFFVIDQGVSYLNLMHNNKADFFLEHNKRSTHQLKRKDVDWSQSPIIFFSSALMKNQQYPRGLKDLGIELWEVHKYTNSLIGFDEMKTFI